MRAVSLALLWAAVLCGGAGVFFAFLLYDARIGDPPELVYAVAATVLLVLAGEAVLMLIALRGVARMLSELDR